jgi:hypothetical protein
MTCALIATAFAAGCARHIDRLPFLDFPPYHDPHGFSSTYHRSLYGPVTYGAAVASAAPQQVAAPTEVRESEGPGYLFSDERQESLREALPGSRFADRLKRGPVASGEADPPRR